MYINRGIDPTEIDRSEEKPASRKGQNTIGDTNMPKFAAELLAMDSGQRVFLRPDPMLAFNLSQVVNFLRAKSRGGDFQAASDLTELENANTELMNIKNEFYATNSIGEKKQLAAKYKSQEAELLSLLSKGA